MEKYISYEKTAKRGQRILVHFAWLIVLIVYLSVSASATSSDIDLNSEQDVRKYVNENDTWAICYAQGTRTGQFYQYDSTSDFMYFSYSQSNCVDVYNTEGIFLYSFIFPDRQNGGIGVRCEENNVYISTKDNDVYIFEGIDKIAKLNHDDAIENGYDFFWFDDNEPNIIVDHVHISWIDDTGSIVSQISTPRIVQQTMRNENLAVYSAALVPIGFVLLIMLIRSRGLNDSKDEK